MQGNEQVGTPYWYARLGLDVDTSGPEARPTVVKVPTAQELWNSLIHYEKSWVECSLGLAETYETLQAFSRDLAASGNANTCGADPCKCPQGRPGCAFYADVKTRVERLVKLNDLLRPHGCTSHFRRCAFHRPEVTHQTAASHIAEVYAHVSSLRLILNAPPEAQNNAARAANRQQVSGIYSELCRYFGVDAAEIRSRNRICTGPGCVFLRKVLQGILEKWPQGPTRTVQGARQTS